MPCSCHASVSTPTTALVLPAVDTEREGHPAALADVLRHLPLCRPLRPGPVDVGIGGKESLGGGLDLLWSEGLRLVRGQFLDPGL
jgi:hypothetical protein